MYNSTLPSKVVRPKICLIIMSLTRLSLTWQFPYSKGGGNSTRKLCKVEVVSVYNLFRYKELRRGGEEYQTVLRTIVFTRYHKVS